jgi:hypothetical protein
MSTSSTEPFAEWEHIFAQTRIANLKWSQTFLAWKAPGRRFLCVGVYSLIAVVAVLGLFGQNRLFLALALLIGVVLGESTSRSWIKATRSADVAQEARMTELCEKWERTLEGGVMETLSFEVTEYVFVEGEADCPEDGVYFLSLGETGVLCLAAFYRRAPGFPAAASSSAGSR